MYFNFLDISEKKNLSINNIANNYLEYFEKFTKSYKIYLDKKNIFKIIYFLHLKKKNKKNIFHFNFLWSYKIFLIVLFFKNQNNFFFFSPHGMLLNSSIKKNSIKFIIKKIIIFFYNKIFDKNFIMIAITRYERKCIKKYFKKCKIVSIPHSVHNNVKLKDVKIDNSLIYFGRVNKHKNILTIVKSFARSKIDQKWILNLYLINDQNFYMNEIENFILSNKLKKRVFIRKPIFNVNKKFKILQKSWCSIQASSSEVLSLANLESALNELPFIYYNIGTNTFQNSKINLKLSNISEDSIKKKIELICSISKNQRISLGKYLKKKFLKNYSKKIFLKNCNNFMKPFY